MEILTDFKQQMRKHGNKLGVLLGFMFLMFGAFQANGQTYCTPSPGCQGQSSGSPTYIDSVSLGSLNNGTNGCSGSGYGDFTNLTAPVFNKGGSVNFAVEAVSPDYLAIFVDWDNDGDFNGSNEEVFNGGMSNNPETGSFNVPSNASTGNLRVRVVYSLLDPITTSCPGASYWGEVEDYEIFIDLGPGEDAAVSNINAPSNPTGEGGCYFGANDNVKVQISSVKGDAIDSVPVNYQVNDGTVVQDTFYNNIPGGENRNFTFSQTADLSGYDSTYNIKVWTDYGADTIPSNDTMETTVNKLGVIDEPYLETFENESVCDPGGCPSNGSCPLSGQWVNGSLNDDFDWSVGRGLRGNIHPGTGVSADTTANGDPLTGPYYDHTEGVSPLANNDPPYENRGGTYIYTDGANSCDDAEAYLTSFCIDANQFDSAYLSFWYHMYGDDIPDLEVQVDTGGSWNTIWARNGEQQTSARDPWRNGDTLLPQNGVYQIRFVVSDPDWGDESHVALDDIRIDNYTSCEKPDELQVLDHIDSTKVQVAWEPGQDGSGDWTIEYGKEGFELGTGQTMSVSDSFATLTGLEVNTDYEFYVQESCANGDTSYWQEAGEKFVTDCAPKSDTLIKDEFAVEDSAGMMELPIGCWNALVELEDPYYYFPYMYTAWNASDSYFVMSNGVDNSVDEEDTLFNRGADRPGDFLGFVSPPLEDLSSNSRRVRFEARYSGESGPDNLIIGTMSNRTDTGTFEAVDTIPASDISQSWQEFTVPLLSISSDHKYLVFRHGATNRKSAEIAIDTIQYTHLPACDAPSNLTLDSMRHDSAWVSWNSGESPDNQWHLEYGPEGFSPGNGTVVSGLTDSSYAISGLTEATDYDVHVREQCDPSTFSENIGPANFTTPCRVREAPWHENFPLDDGSYSAYPCWRFVEGGDMNVDIDSSGNYGTSPYSVVPGTRYVAMQILGTSGGSGFVVSPEISDLGDRTNQLRFHSRSEEPFLPERDDSVTIFIGTMTDQNDTSTFSAIDSILVEADDTWKEHSFWLHPYEMGSGDYLAFRLSGIEGKQTLLDSIVYETIPDCEVGLYADTIYGWAREGAYGFNAFNGEMNEGTMSEPDTACMGDSATLELTAPYGYANSDYGSEWSITNVTAATETGIGVSDFNIAPSGGDNAQVGFIPNGIVEDSLVRVEVDVEFSTLGCDTTLTRYVHVAPSPDAAFAFDDNLCARNDINLSNNSTNVTSASTFNWSFEDGTTSNAVNPQKSFNSGGEYEIQLDVTNKYGCSDHFTDTVDVNYNPDVGYTNTASEVCLGESIDFTDTSVFGGSSNLTRNWDFGDGNSGSGQNVSHAYTGSGSYEVTLTVNSDEGCVDSMSKTVVVNDTPNVAFNVQDTCAGNEVHFTNNSSIANGNLDYTWHFGDGNTSNLQEPDHLYGSAGDYDVKLVAEGNGCADSVTKTVTIHHTPNAGFTSSSESICLGEGVDLTDTSQFGGSGGLNESWDFGDGNGSNVSAPNYAYQSSGRYDVKLVVTSGEGCMDSASKPVTVNDTPTVDFDAPQVCAGETLEFSNNSGLASGSLSYTWKFEDGTTSNLEEPDRTYNTPGEYDVKLVASSGNGCADSVTKAVTVNELPEAGFTAPDVCEGSATSFMDTSSMGSGSIMAYQWDFGDGNIGINANPSYRYSDTGNYEVQLVVTSDEGCMDTAEQMARVNPVPNAAFDASDVCFGDTVEFMNQTQYGGNNDLEFTWYFGDNDSSDAQNPDHVYDQTGDYTVELVVEDTVTGCMDMVQHQVSVNEQPEADFSVSSVCEGGDLMIEDETVFSGNGFLEYTYTVNGQSIDAGRNPVIRDMDTGSYEIVLQVSTANGCVSAHDTTVEVRPAPEVDFNAPASVCAEANVSFDNLTAYKGAADSVDYVWKFGNGDTARSEAPEYQYGQGGTYEVTLVASSANGCKDSLSQMIEVRPVVSSDFNFTIVDNETVAFEAADTTGLSYQWDFGDGNRRAEVTTTEHVYDTSGSYGVSLTVRSGNGCSTTSTDTVEMENVGIGDASQANRIAFDAYPNPFEGDATIEYRLAETSEVKLEVYNSSGKRLNVMADEEQNAGEYEYTFNGEQIGSAGVLLIRLTVDGQTKVKKLIKAK